MTQALNKNYMAVNRLKLLAKNRIAMDQQFSSGINVLWGSNGAGKSTVLDLIYYALGGNDVAWKEVAHSFEHVSLEIVMGGDVVTLARKFDSRMPPIDFFWGTMDASEEAPANKWVSHSSKSTADKESYSDVLFSLLGWPVLKSSEFNSITMTQVLRLIYGDQPSPPTKIFREANFDSETTKGALGDFVLGAFNSVLYKLKGIISDLESDLASSRTQVQAIRGFLDKIDGEKTRLEIESAISSLRAEVSALYDRASELELEGDDRQLSDHIELRSNFDNLSLELLELDQRIETVSLDVSDSAQFIRTLMEHLTSLEEATTLRDFLSDLKFDTCPSCLAPIEPAEPGCCHLCKAPLTDGSVTRHRMRARYELQMQLEESKLIRERRIKQLDAMQRERESLSSERSEAYSAYIAQIGQASTAGKSARERIFLEIGKFEERISLLHGRFEIVSKLEDLEGRVEELTGQLAEASVRHSNEEKATSRQRSAARVAITEEAVWFLRNDLNYQTEFMDAEKVDINFAKEIIAVDGIRRFSDSGHVYLKNSVLVALLAASLQKTEMCMPSFLMLDGIEDKGMEVERIHALQNNILNKSIELNDTSFQVIFTGTTISERIIEEANIIGGRRFSRTDRLITI
ncbi:MAG: AAA family ATPase [Oceanicaulis sp.]